MARHLPVPLPHVLVLLTTACFSDAPSVEGGGSGDTDPPPSDTTSSTSSDAGASTTDPASTTAPGTSSGAEGDASSGEASSTGEPAVPELIGRWDFDGDLRDVGPHGFDGAPVGDLAYVDVDVDQGVVLDGAGGYVDLSAAAPMLLDNLDAVTVSLLLQADAWDPPFSLLVMLGNAAGAPPDTNLFGFRAEAGSLHVLTSTDAGENHKTILGDVPEIGAWTRLTFVVDGDEASLYVDGVLQTATPFVVPDTTATELAVGAWWDGTQAFVGTLDDLALYAGALTPEQVADL